MVFIRQTVLPELIFMLLKIQYFNIFILVLTDSGSLPCVLSFRHEVRVSKGISVAPVYLPFQQYVFGR